MSYFARAARQPARIPTATIPISAVGINWFRANYVSEERVVQGIGDIEMVEENKKD